MGAQFDPYQQWLQIPVDRRPPTHYDLLGLPAFEADPAQIQAAATERIGHVRKYQVGAHGDAAIRLMGEISLALTCLLDAASKQQYDAQLRGMTTVADAASSATATHVDEPRSQELAPAQSADKPTDVPTSPIEPEGYGLAPLPEVVAGPTPSGRLDRLEAIVQMTEPAEGSNARSTALNATLQPATAYSGLSAPAATAETPGMMNRLVFGVPAAACLVLVALLGAWAVTGGDKQQVADNVVVEPADMVHGDTSDSASTEGNSSVTDDANTPKAPIPAAVAHNQAGQWQGKLLDVYCPTGGQLGKAHLLVQLDNRRDKPLEVIAHDMGLVVSLNDYVAERDEPNGGDRVVIEGTEVPAENLCFADALSGSCIQLQSIQKANAPDTRYVVGSNQPRFAAQLYVTELAGMYRFRPPAGTLVEFEATYLDLVQDYTGVTMVTVISPGNGDRKTFVRFPRHTISEVAQQFRPGERVVIQATVESSMPHPAVLSLVSSYMRREGRLPAVIGTPATAIRVRPVLDRWNSLFGARNSPTPLPITADLTVAAAAMSWAYPMPAPTAVTSPPTVAPVASTPAAPSTPMAAATASPVPSAPPSVQQGTAESWPDGLEYLAYVVPNLTNRIINTDPEQTLAAHARQLTVEELQLFARVDGQVLQGFTYHIFKIRNTGATQLVWNGSSGGNKLAIRYWNGQEFFDQKNSNWVQGPNFLYVRRPLSEPFVYVMISGGDRAIVTDFFQVLTSNAKTVASAGVTAAQAGVPTIPAGSMPREEFKAKLNELNDKFTKAKNSTASNLATWTEIVASLTALEQQIVTEEEKADVDRLRKRLASLAEDRVEAAIRNRKNFFLSSKFLNEASVLDPNGEAGAKARQLLNVAK